MLLFRSLLFPSQIGEGERLLVAGGHGGLPAVQGGQGPVKLQVDHPVAPGAVVEVEHLADGMSFCNLESFTEVKICLKGLFFFIYN